MVMVLVITLATNDYGDNDTCRAADWKAALSWLRWLLDKLGPDPLLLSRIGYVQLAMGHIPAAEVTFARTAAIAATPAYGTDKMVQAAVRRNQGLLLAANQDYKGALDMPSARMSDPRAALHCT